MATEFVTARFPGAEMPKVQDRAEMRDRVRGFVRPGERARLREAGADFGPWRRQPELLDRILERVDRAGVGPKIIVQRENDREMLSIREVTLVPDLGANETIEEVHAAVFDEFDVRSGGLWLCRFIDGTKTVSHHGYRDPAGRWKGAAEDVFVNAGGMPALVDVAEFVVDRARRHVWSGEVIEVIVDQSIWTAPDYRERVYGGLQHFHKHTGVAGGVPCL